MFHRTTRLAVYLALSILLVSALLGVRVLPTSAAAPTAITTNQVGLRIPLGKAVEMDGICRSGEYADAIIRPFNDAGGPGAVYLKHDGTYLYVCVQARPGQRTDRFETIYLDPQGDGSSYEFAQKNDYGLKVGILNNAKTSQAGTGVTNGYVTDSSIDALWDGKAN